MNKRERWLRDNGYVFTGHYSSDLDGKGKMKAIATEYRKQGHRAQVLTKSYAGRIYNTEGYSVYVREMKKA